MGRPEVLILGGEYCGKSLLIRRIKETCDCSYDSEYCTELTAPTVGMELAAVQMGKWHVDFREIGSAIMLNWDSYIPECSHIVFIVDLSDLANVAASLVHIHEILVLVGNCAREKKMLIALNKSDLATTMSTEEIKEYLDIESVLEDHEHVECVSGSSLDDSLARLVVAWVLKSLQ